MKTMVKTLLLLLATTLVITGCMRQHTRLQRGKESYQRQDYYQAFQRLKSIAKAGDAEAQYAIGYMYYFGKGVLEDKRLGKEWMQRAADQHHVLAQQALRIMASHRTASTQRPYDHTPKV